MCANDNHAGVRGDQNEFETEIDEPFPPPEIVFDVVEMVFDIERSEQTPNRSIYHAMYLLHLFLTAVRNVFFRGTGTCVRLSIFSFVFWHCSAFSFSFHSSVVLTFFSFSFS